MKAKKAIKRLDHVETLLSDVIDQFAAADGVVRELLDSAKETVLRAKAEVNEQEKPKSGKKKSPAKRKGVRAATGSRQAEAKTA